MPMPATARRKTSLTLDATALDEARALGVNVSAVADAALRKAVVEARQRQWVEDNRAAFDAQAKWHEENGHPLSDIMLGPGPATWTG